MSTTRIVLGVFAAAALVFVSSCADYDESDRVNPAVGPQGADFFPVALMLVDRCGQIDCHGSKYRNFRLYGYSSQRVNPFHTPSSPETTQEEVNENYNALVSLEPTILQQVIREGGAQPDRLTFIRKAREQESHKGGKPIVPGDDADICIQSWLQGQVRAENCRLAVPRLNIP